MGLKIAGPISPPGTDATPRPADACRLRNPTRCKAHPRATSRALTQSHDGPRLPLRRVQDRCRRRASSGAAMRRLPCRRARSTASSISLEHRERAVGRDELIAAVWGRTETGDGTLGQTVLAARRALDDTGKEQHAIRTVFRFGYHWVAPVDIVEEAPTTVPVRSGGPARRNDSQSAATQRRVPPRASLRERSLSPRVAIVLALVFVAIVQRQYRDRAADRRGRRIARRDRARAAGHGQRRRRLRLGAPGPHGPDRCATSRGRVSRSCRATTSSR